MGDIIKTLLSESIKVLEQGAFQEFCLSFLPIFNSRFVGLERQGGTADGKTRAGTPDLLKTNPDGSHICIQCSTDKDYWQKPSNINDWKPIKDIIACVNNIDNIVEIVLCVSPEIPTNLPKVKSAIKENAKKYTNTLITILSLSTFEEIIQNNIFSYSFLIKRFCPILHEHLSAITSASTANAKINFYKKYPISLDSIESIFEKFYKGSNGAIEIKELELEITRIAKSRFQRMGFQESIPIKRESVNEFLLNNKIEENTYLVLGVPKIGKSSWVYDICLETNKQGLEIIWFNAPYEQFELNDFIHDLKRIVIGKLIGFDISNQYADGKIGLHELTSHLSSVTLDREYLLVIDDIQYLSDDVLNNIKDIIIALKKDPIYKNVGMILISNKKLSPITETVASTILCPHWNEREIEQLLLLMKVDIQDEIKSYCKLMVPTCGGHPLVALALARKAPRIIDLLPLKPKSLPALYDEELTDEITRILFDDLLKDADHRDFVLRLSVLMFRFDLDLANFVSTNIMPGLRTPVKLMFENLKGTVIEGDEQLNYSVAFIFSKVAQTYLIEEKKQEIWEQAGNYLITPKDRIYHIDKMIDAIYYSIIAHKFENVFYWTSLIIYLISKKPPPKEQIKNILDRLSIVEALIIPIDDKLQMPYFMASLAIAIKYTEIEELDKSNAILSKVIQHPIGQSDVPELFPQSGDYINTSARFFYFLNLLRTKNASSALKILNKSDVNLFIKINLSSTRDIGILHTAIQQGGSNDFPKDFIGEMVKTVSLNDNLLLGELSECFIGLGFKASKEKNSPALNIIPDDETLKNMSLWLFFLNIATASYELESNNPTECVKITEEILKSINSLKVGSNKIMNKIHQMRGDAFFNLKDREKAFKEYSNSLTFIDKTTKSFDYAWSNYRMGICASDIDDSITFFTNASKGFNDIEMSGLKARSDGESAVAYYQKGEVDKAFGIIVDLADGYYLKGIEEYGPAVAIGLAASYRLISELKKEPFDESSTPGKLWPKLEKEVFAKVLDEAKPEAGICSAYYIISNTFEYLNNKKQQINSLSISFNCAPINETEQKAKVLSGLNLVVLLSEQHNIEETIKIISKLFSEKREIDLKNERVWVYYFFRQNEVLLKQGIVSLNDYTKILNAVEIGVDKLSGNIRHWWLSEIYLRKGGIDGVTGEKDYKPDFLSHALEYAIKSNNYEVMRDAGHQIGFRYLSKVKTFKELAETHLLVVLGICNDGGDISRLKIVGTNLINLWISLELKRLTDTDLPYWRNLRDRARNISGKASEELHAPLMIIFLLLVAKMEADSNYEKALTWAINEIKDTLGKVPSDDYEYIKHLFPLAQIK